MLAPSSGGLILYQAYGNLYAMTVAGDSDACIKRRHPDQSSNGVRNMAMASGCGRLKEDLESSTWRRRQDCEATSSRRHLYKYKFVFKSYEGVFLGYSQTSQAYIVLNKETMRIEESLNVTFDESLPEPMSSSSIEDDRILEPAVQNPVRSPSLKSNALELGYLNNVKKAKGEIMVLPDNPLGSPDNVLNNQIFDTLRNDSFSSNVEMSFNDEEDNGVDMIIPQSPIASKNTLKVMLVTHGSSLWNKGEQRSRRSTCHDIYSLPLQRYQPSNESPRSRLFDLTKRGERKQREDAYGSGEKS
nr:retrotransposon protein [Tanacetum cinerariifolium]